MKTVFILGAIVVVSLVVYNWFITNDYMMHRLEQTLEGNSSGRDVIYTTAWHAWFDCNNLGHYLFGFGYLGTICHPLMHGYMAHNDWLEILVDYGLVGVDVESGGCASLLFGCSRCCGGFRLFLRLPGQKRGGVEQLAYEHDGV